MKMKDGERSREKKKISGKDYAEVFRLEVIACGRMRGLGIRARPRSQERGYV